MDFLLHGIIWVLEMVYSKAKALLGAARGCGAPGGSLLALSPRAAADFLAGFDTIVSDCDGVLWREIDKPIPGVKKVMERLKGLDKRIHFVSNNSSKTLKRYQHQFKLVGIDLEEGDLIHPVKSIISFLKSKDFKKKVFCVGTSIMVNALEEAGIQCVVGPNDFPESIEWFLQNSIDNLDVGAVVLDFDIHLNYFKINTANEILKRNDVYFIVGATDKYFPIRESFSIIGSGYFQNILTETSNRQPIIMGKPSEYLVPIVMEYFKITNPARTLFIGDMLEQDMAFGSKCGFQKLLVLSGGTRLEELQKSKEPLFQPNFWIESLGHLEAVLDQAEKFLK